MRVRTPGFKPTTRILAYRPDAVAQTIIHLELAHPCILFPVEPIPGASSQGARAAV
jgi:hypothetical protein